MGPGGPPTSNFQAQEEWRKMQNAFYMEKAKKNGGMNMGMMPGGPMGPGPGGMPPGMSPGGMPPGMNPGMGPMGMQGGPMGPRGPMMGGPGGQRMPGPPPPYPAGRQHPGPGASPNPHSPATSLPMSSPGGGMMNSPRPMGSNPGTPVSGPPMSSPVIGKNSPGDGSSSQHGMSNQGSNYFIGFQRK